MEGTHVARLTAGVTARHFRVPDQHEGSSPLQKHTISADGILPKPITVFYRIDNKLYEFLCISLPKQEGSRNARYDKGIR